VTKEELFDMLRDNLTVEVERRSLGHMSAEEEWMIVKFDGRVVTEALIRREECEGEWT